VGVRQNVDLVEIDKFPFVQRVLADNLARVNLFVGENNCGKTSLLEAIRLLAADSEAGAILSIAAQRGEFAPGGNGNSQSASLPVSSFASHLFGGHSFEAGKYLEIAGDDCLGVLRLSVAALDEENHPVDAPGTKEEDAVVIGIKLALYVERLGVEDADFWIIPGGKVLTMNGNTTSPRFRRKKSIRSLFAGSDMFFPSELARLWDDVLVSRRDGEVRSAMRVLEPRLQDIAFLAGNTDRSNSPRTGIVVALEGEKRRVPLGSLGEGVYRLLALALALSWCRGGILLLDEIDTGLHYSVMGNVWRMVVKTAIDLDVNVFATTHSYDCIRGLAWLCENHPELGEQVSLHKIDRSRDHSVACDAERIVRTFANGIEVR